MSDTDRSVNHKDQSATLSRIEGPGLPQRLFADGDVTATGDRPADFATGLASLAFIRSAIWRGARLWCATAIIGLLIGLGVYVSSPATYHASASVLLTLGPYENANSASQDNQAIAQSREVAGLATRMLGLKQDPGILLADYTVAISSPDVLRITATASSPSEAVSRANAAAAAFLQFRADQLELEQNVVLSTIDQQISQAKQQLGAINRQISQLPAKPASTAQQAELSKLQTEQTQLGATLSALQQAAAGNRASTATKLAVKHSEVLDAAVPAFQSRLKRALPRPAVGFMLGLVLGIGFVVIRALSSDKLLRRDDVAQALGAPVQLSVGNIRLSRWRPRKRGLAAANSADVRRIVAHLRKDIPATSQGTAALAVIPVDDPDIAALSVVSLALSCAEQGSQVMVADLVNGAPAARLLKVGKPGVHTAQLRGVDLVVAVPEPEDVGPSGPFGRTAPWAQPTSFSDAVAAGSASADLLLTLAALDSSLGGDHLPTWAAGAVVMVTAGESSWTRIHAVGQMVRMAGMPLMSTILVGADKHDESLGRMGTPRSAVSADTGLGGVGR